MKQNLLFCLLLFLPVYSLQAQETSPVEDFPELKENAYSMVVNNQIDFTCESPTSATKKESITITILDPKGKEEGNFTSMCDKFSTLRNFTGEIRDKTGKVIRKIKKSDLRMTEYSSGLASDDYLYYYECNGPSCPYTVYYEWEIKYKDGLIMYPVFAPQKKFNQSVANATYRIYNPGNVNYRWKAINSEMKPEMKKNPKGESFQEIAFHKLKAFDRESYGPSIIQLTPYVYFTPAKFFYDGSQGSMESWEEYGLWGYSLLKGRDVLPEPLKAKLKEITTGCNTDREKVKAVYDYLAKTTRYVSIQLGIGGFQPALASSVNKSGFGDCKGLSNYTSAMLKELGINSYYTEISTIHARFLKDFPSANQTNHIVLNVPLPNDTLWLECTNPQLPFGYVHVGIAGHDALLIKETGGKLCRLPTYPDSLNTQITTARVVLDPLGKAQISARQVSHFFQYEQNSYITQLEPNKQKDFLRSGLHLSSANITKVEVQEKKEAAPSVDVRYSFDSEQYGSKTGNRLFIPSNVFSGRLNQSKKKRVHDIYINNGFLDCDSITIQIPEGFVVESLPKPMTADGKFGVFQSSVQQVGKDILIVHTLLLRSGKYPKEAYEEFTTFNQTIANQYDSKIIVRKE